MKNLFRCFLVIFCVVLGGVANAQSKILNPDIGVNILGLIQKGSQISDDPSVVPHNGISLQEAEIQFSADIDAYFKGVANFSVGQETGSQSYKLDPEEVYFETISLPSITLKGGKFKAPLGKHNQLHTHAFPFIDAPLISNSVLGDEGLNEPTVMASSLIPLGWFSEATVGVLSLGNENLFKSSSSGELGRFLRFKNLWDLSEDLTMELGLSLVTGQNQFKATSNAQVVDLTFKWRPSVGGKYKSLIWSSEYLQAQRGGFVNSEIIGGLYSYIQYQLAQRWWVGGRYEYLGLPHSDGINCQNKQSAIVGFFPTEFSGLRLQYSRTNTIGVDQRDESLTFQFNLSMGAHPAHSY